MLSKAEQTAWSFQTSGVDFICSNQSSSEQTLGREEVTQCISSVALSSQFWDMQQGIRMASLWWQLIVISRVQTGQQSSRSILDKSSKLAALWTRSSRKSGGH